MVFTKRNKEYFRVINGYTFDKRLFWAASALIVIIACVGVAQYGLGSEDHIFLECPENAPGGLCFNPLYEPFCYDWYCKDQYLVAGFSYGERAPFLVAYFGWFVAAILAAAFAVNHVRYNGGV